MMPDQTSESSRIGLIVASHGNLARSLVETGELVLGRKTLLRAFFFNDGDEPKKILGQLRALARKSDRGEGVIIMVDLFGGTPGSLALSMMFGDKKVEVLTGANLPMIIAAAKLSPAASLAEACRTIVDAGAGAIMEAGSMLAGEKR